MILVDKDIKILYFWKTWMSVESSATVTNFKKLRPKILPFRKSLVFEPNFLLRPGTVTINHKFPIIREVNNNLPVEHQLAFCLTFLGNLKESN
jgi:hypothetical protein